MSEIFVSYAREDERYAERVADALRGQGYGVWRDDELPAHRAYAEVIEERLKAAKAVVVLWSAEASKSQWVRSEANLARSAGTLAQATLDGSLPPMPFDQIQCADLQGWDGSTDVSGWRKLARSVEALAGRPSEAPKEKARRVSREVSICVLPFANMSGDAEQEYFSDGISEDVTTDLSKVSALEVIARNTAFQFKGQSVDVCDIARKLGVSHVLEGSVRRAGSRVRITAQLIDGKSGGHIWADRYDRDLTDIFAIQDEISKAIVESLKVKLLPEEKKAIEERGTSNVDAYNLYLMARQTWITGSHGDPRREETVIRICDRVLEIEPAYAQVWALKALAEAALFYGYNRGSNDGVASADRALELNAALAEAYAVKARAAAACRQFEEAEVLIERALRLAPDSWEVNHEAALIFYWGQKFPRAARFLERCTELLANDRHSLEMLMSVYRVLGDETALRRTAERVLEAADSLIAENPNNSAIFGSGANALLALGEEQRATEWIDRALLIDPDNLNLRYNFVCTLLTARGRSDPAVLDLAFKHLDFVFERSVGSIVRRADLDPDLESIRGHPHFQEIYAAAMQRIAKLDAEKAKEAVSPPAAA